MDREIAVAVPVGCGAVDIATTGRAVAIVGEVEYYRPGFPGSPDSGLEP